MSRFLCKVCESECDFPVYKKNLVNAVNYFLLAVQQKNQTYLNVLENPKDSTYFDSKIMINSTHKYNGFNILQTGPFCVHS
jgi:hypothetical protein